MCTDALALALAPRCLLLLLICNLSPYTIPDTVDYGIVVTESQIHKSDLDTTVCCYIGLKERTVMCGWLDAAALVVLTLMVNRYK